MNYISENDGCTQADIAERLQVTAACVATSTKRLQKSGFITKTIDEDNLRCKRLSLTPLGKKALDECHAPFDEYDNYIFRNIKKPICSLGNIPAVLITTNYNLVSEY